ncbi:MAG: hypothetical protein QS99_C0003G0024 [archaeon GW2011_AR4]|nr:MAG: hypothetical protein QS99_C0003G0024 [archaeon GW2011_AR4]
MDADKRAISVVVKPNAPKTRLISIDDHGVHHIAIAAAPDKGKANTELIKFLTKELGKPVKIISGSTSKKKLIKIL